MPTEDAANSSPATPPADKSAETAATPEVITTPEVAPAPEVIPAPKTTSKPKIIASARTFPKKVSASTPSSEESNASTATTYRPRSTRAGGYLCDSVEFTKYERLHDGEGGFMKGKVLAYNSKQCGYVAPIAIKDASRSNSTTTQEPIPAPEQWIADPLSPEKCEDGILYKFEKSAQTGVGRKVKVGVCAVETAKPDYLNKSIQQVKDDGLIKKGESGTRKKDN